MYVSEFTKFMNEYIDQNPEVAEERLTLRGKLWDVDLKTDEQKGFKAGKVPNKPYAYQPK